MASGSLPKKKWYTVKPELNVFLLRITQVTSEKKIQNILSLQKVLSFPLHVKCPKHAVKISVML